MSVVTTVLLTYSTMEPEIHDDAHCPGIDAVNDWLRGEARGLLLYLNPAFGGHKVPQIRVFGGAFNALDHEGFLAAVRAAPWEEPENVQVWFNYEQEARMTAVIV